MVLFFLATKVFQKGTMLWMSLCFSLTWDSVACNGWQQGFVVAWVCIAAPSAQKNSPFAAQLKIAFRWFLFTLYLRAIFQVQVLRGLYLEGRFNGVFFRVRGLAGLYLEGLIHGGAYFGILRCSLLSSFRKSLAMDLPRHLTFGGKTR